MSGAAELGYGDGDEATVVSFGPSSSNKFITTYFRQSFQATAGAGLAVGLPHGKLSLPAYAQEITFSRDYEGTTRTIDAHIYNLRKALGKAGERIQSVGATGYKWMAPE